MRLLIRSRRLLSISSCRKTIRAVTQHSWRARSLPSQNKRSAFSIEQSTISRAEQSTRCVVASSISGNAATFCGESVISITQAALNSGCQINQEFKHEILFGRVGYRSEEHT